MAVRINPCHGCPLGKGCEQRAEFRARVSGLGLRSASFRCQKIADALRPGRRIMVSAPVLRWTCSFYDEGPSCDIEHTAVKATITSGDDAGQFTCVVDPGQVRDEDEDEDVGLVDVKDKFRFRRKAGAHRIIKFLDEPDATICEGGKVMRGGECDVPSGEVCYCEQLDQLATLSDIDLPTFAA